MRLIVLLMVLLASGSARADVRPQISIAVASSHDDSHGDRNAAERDANRETIREALLVALRSSPDLTTIAQRGIEARRVDLTVVALDLIEGASGLQLQTKLRIVISDATGKILSIVTGGARLDVPRHTYGARLRVLEKQLLQEAMQGMFAPLRAHLLRTVAAC